MVRDHAALPLFLATMVLGCANTAIDAIVANDVATDGGTQPGDAATCTSTRDAPGPGLYRFFSASSGRCLAAGPPTTVAGQPAFATQMSANCGSDAELWEVEATLPPGRYRLRNVARALQLDIERDVPLEDLPNAPPRMLGIGLRSVRLETKTAGD